MKNALGDHESLSGSELYGAIFQVNQKFPFHYVKKFIIGIVFVPVILSFDHGQTNYRIIDLAQRLVIPLVRTRIRKRLFLDDLERFVEGIEVYNVGIFSLIAHRNSSLEIARIVESAAHYKRDIHMDASQIF